MWFEFDETGVPLGAWTWDEEEQLWLFDDDVPLGLFPTFPALDEPVVAVLPMTGLQGNTSLYALLLGFAISTSVVTVTVIKREKRQAKV